MATSIPAAGAAGAPTAGGASGGPAHLQELQSMNQQMQGFTAETTSQEMDMKMFNNVERAIQTGIQGMPA